MRQYKPVFCLGLVTWILALMASPPLSAAEGPAQKENWENVKKLAPGDEIKVVLRKTNAYRGTVESVSGDSISIMMGTGKDTFPRQDVVRISAKRPGRGRAICALVGMGIGGAIGGALGNYSPTGGGVTTGADTRTGALIGMGIGAGIGVLLPLFQWWSVYRATPLLAPDAQAAPASPALVAELSTVVFKSTPGGATVVVDDKQIATTPSTIQLAPGDHTVSIEKSGFKAWQRTVTVSARGNITIDATLEKTP